MKKLIICVAMIFALSTSAAIMAQTPATPKKVTKTECCNKHINGGCDKKCDKKGDSKCTCKNAKGNQSCTCNSKNKK